MTCHTASIIISCGLREDEQQISPVYGNFTLFKARHRGNTGKKTSGYAYNQAQIDDKLRLNGKDAPGSLKG